MFLIVITFSILFMFHQFLCGQYFLNCFFWPIYSYCCVNTFSSLRSSGSPSVGNGNSQYSILTGASLALRLGELISPEDEQQLTSVVQAGQGNDGDDDMFANVRSNKSHTLNHTVRAL